jgi:hypothetical protein
MLRPQWLESAIGGPLTKALNKAYASRLQSVQDREKSSGPDAGFASASSIPSSPYEPAEIDPALLSPRHRMQGRRALRPIRQPVAIPSHAHWRCGQQVWTSLWGKLFTDEETDAPGPPLELELSLRAAWDQERQRLEVAARLQRACEASKEKQYRLRELHLANGKRRRRLLQARREGRAAALPSTFGAAAAKIAWTSSRSAPGSTRADARRAGWRSVRLVAESGAESCRAYPRKAEARAR